MEIFHCQRCCRIFPTMFDLHRHFCDDGLNSNVNDCPICTESYNDEFNNEACGNSTSETDIASQNPFVQLNQTDDNFTEGNQYPWNNFASPQESHLTEDHCKDEKNQEYYCANQSNTDIACTNKEDVTACHNKSQIQSEAKDCLRCGKTFPSLLHFYGHFCDQILTMNISNSMLCADGYNDEFNLKAWVNSTNETDLSGQNPSIQPILNQTEENFTEGNQYMKNNCESRQESHLMEEHCKDEKHQECASQSNTAIAYANEENVAGRHNKYQRQSEAQPQASFFNRNFMQTQDVLPTHIKPDPAYMFLHHYRNLPHQSEGSSFSLESSKEHTISHPVAAQQSLLVQSQPNENCIMPNIFPKTNFDSYQKSPLTEEHCNYEEPRNRSNTVIAHTNDCHFKEVHKNSHTHLGASTLSSLLNPNHSTLQNVSLAGKLSSIQSQNEMEPLNLSLHKDHNIPSQSSRCNKPQETPFDSELSKEQTTTRPIVDQRSSLVQSQTDESYLKQISAECTPSKSDKNIENIPEKN